MLEIYILEISRNLGKDDFNNFLNTVSLEKKEKVNRFHKYEDAQRSLLGEALARHSICHRLGIKNSHLIFGSNGFGKPVLEDLPGLHFNISHSGNLVVCAVDDKPVGIDVEIIKPIDFQIAEKFFSRDEYKNFINQPSEKKLKYFYMLWTLKESYIKAEGKGLSTPPDSFTMIIGGNDIDIMTHNTSRKYNFYQYFIDGNAICSVCSFAKEHMDYFYNIEQFMERSNLFL